MCPHTRRVGYSGDLEYSEKSGHEGLGVNPVVEGEDAGREQRLEIEFRMDFIFYKD